MEKIRLSISLTILGILMSACNLPSPTTEAATPTEVAPTSVPAVEPAAAPTETALPEFTHTLFPATSVSIKDRVYDVVSIDTARENRAPYGDSYDINRLERPFTQDMIYAPDLDIITFDLNSDTEWHYVSIELVGKNPNSDLDIRYGVEIDNDADGYGDLIIWANAPYSDEWTNENVNVYEDRNRNTAGLSSTRSDAPLQTDGYESPIFDLLGGLAEDPDLAWVRTTLSPEATIQFAFKRSLPNDSFMLGVIADAGLRDVGQLDYVDRFTKADAGSPVRSNQYYPLGELYLVDNTCREAFGFTPNGYEPMLCPPPAPVTSTPGETTSCPQNPLQFGSEVACETAGCIWKVTQSSWITGSKEIYYCAQP